MVCVRIVCRGTCFSAGMARDSGHRDRVYGAGSLPVKHPTAPIPTSGQETRMAPPFQPKTKHRASAGWRWGKGNRKTVWSSRPLSGWVCAERAMRSTVVLSDLSPRAPIPHRARPPNPRIWDDRGWRTAPLTHKVGRGGCQSSKRWVHTHRTVFTPMRRAVGIRL